MSMSKLVRAPDSRPSKHSLVESGNRVDTGDGRWENGVIFTPTLCYELKAYTPDCPPADKSPYEECQAPIEFLPYMVEIGIVWNTVDSFDAKAVVTDALAAGTSSMLEDMIAVSGQATQPANSILDDGAAVTASTPLELLGAVEAAIIGTEGHVGSGGTIHMGPQAAAQVWGNLEETDGRLHTKATGAAVIIGNYPTDTIYGHVGEIDVYLSDIIVTEANDTLSARTNEVAIRAERFALAAWQSCATYKGTVS